MDPLMIDVPAELVGERLVLRAPCAGESAAINREVIGSITELAVWMPWATPTPTWEDSELYSRRSQARWLLREQLDYRIQLKDTGQFIGCCGLLHLNWKVPRGEIGYWMSTAHSGKGYMTEAVPILTRMCLETMKFRRVEIRMDDRNEKSWRVAERAGFTLEAVLRCDGRDVAGTLRDTRVYAKTARD